MDHTTYFIVSEDDHSNDSAIREHIRESDPLNWIFIRSYGSAMSGVCLYFLSIEESML